METNDYVSYEIAKKLKACGFDEPCDAFYLPPMKNRPEPFFSGRVKRSIKNESNAFHFSAPTLWHAQKWLREKKKIDVLVYNCACGYLWGVSKANDGTGLISFDEKGDDKDSGCWTTYEGAISAGISAALQLIKKGE